MITGSLPYYHAMRLMVVLLVLGLGVARAAEEEASSLTPEQVDQEAFLDDMEDGRGRIGLARMLGDLFAGDAVEEAESEGSEEVAELDGRAKYDSPGAEERLDAQAQRQYNNLVDTLLRRINAEARKLDPMMVNVTPYKKSGMYKKKSGMYKKMRDPKVLNLDEAENSSENDDSEAFGPGPQTYKHDIERRETDEEEGEEEEEEELVEEGRRLSPEDQDESNLDVQPRRIPIRILPKNKKNNNKRTSKPNSKKRRKQNKKKTKKSGNKKNNKNKNKKNNKKRSGNRRPKSETDRSMKNRNKNNYLPNVRTSRAEVTGFATLRRDGDVKIITHTNGITEVKTDLVTGPVNLKVTRKFGTGKEAITRIGNAASPQMKGSITITIDAPGKKQKITKFLILRPSIVTTHGSLAKEPSKRKDNNFLENTLPRATPVVTKKLMLVAMDILAAN